MENKRISLTPILHEQTIKKATEITDLLTSIQDDKKRLEGLSYIHCSPSVCMRLDTSPIQNIYHLSINVVVPNDILKIIMERIEDRMNSNIVKLSTILKANQEL